jgi:hypothetical protein
MDTRDVTMVVSATAAAGLLTYVRLVRPWTKRWGATDDEVSRSLPGDGIVARADYVATRAITIAAPPGDVWPWLAQIGSGRAGWYSYDRLDNGGVASADRLLPEFQSLAVDDLVPMVPGTEVGVWVKEIEPGRRMLWWDRKGEYSWEWLLEPAIGDATRLVTRLRGTYPPLWSRRTLYVLFATSGDIVMMRRCLLGIRERAERSARSRRADPSQLSPEGASA